jgi:hypothetical protein
MSIIGKIALAALIVLSAAVAASAATKVHKSAGQQRVRQIATPSARINSESPELTGGGSLGHNEMRGW